LYRAIFEISQNLTSVEAKIDEIQSNRHDTWLDTKMTDLGAGVDIVATRVDEKIDELGLSIDSVKRGMEKVHQLNKTIEDGLRMTNKKMDRYELMLRRILGFYEQLEDLSFQQTQMAKDVQDLHSQAFPEYHENPQGTEDDDDETGTQYDNEDKYETLGNGPPLTLFPAPAPFPPISLAHSKI
jgi:hypothetical protein